MWHQTFSVKSPCFLCCQISMFLWTHTILIVVDFIRHISEKANTPHELFSGSWFSLHLIFWFFFFCLCFLECNVALLLGYATKNQQEVWTKLHLMWCFTSLLWKNSGKRLLSHLKVRPADFFWTHNSKNNWIYKSLFLLILLLVSSEVFSWVSLFHMKQETQNFSHCIVLISETTVSIISHPHHL